MSNRSFAILILVIAIVFSVPLFKSLSSSKPKETEVGKSQAKQGENHIPRGKTHEPYKTDLPSSGPHYADADAPTQWGVYIQEVPDEVFLHNEEHGGVIVAYKPDLSADQLKKLQALFAPPYSNKEFSPVKAIVTPRTTNTKAIQMAAWTVTLNLDKYDEAKIKKFYLQNVVKRGPEGTAGPNNTPINQAAQ